MGDQQHADKPREQGEPSLALRLAMLASSMETSIADTNCAVFVNGTPPMQTQIQWIREAVAALEPRSAGTRMSDDELLSHVSGKLPNSGLVGDLRMHPDRFLLAQAFRNALCAQSARKESE